MIVDRRPIALIASPCSPRSASASAQEKAYPTLGTIERIDPRFDALVPKDAQVEKLAEGFDWSEGPVWDRDGRLPALLRRPEEHGLPWKEGDGRPRLPQAERLHRHRPRAGGEPGSNGLVLDPEGRLVLCQHGDRRVARLERRRQVHRRSPTTTRASGSTAPTTRVYHSNGDLYFTDPPYGLLKQNDDPGQGTGLQRRLPPLARRAS